MLTGNVITEMCNDTSAHVYDCFVTELVKQCLFALLYWTMLLVEYLEFQTLCIDGIIDFLYNMNV